MERVHCSAKRVKYAISRARPKTPNDSMSDSEVTYRHLEDNRDIFVSRTKPQRGGRRTERDLPADFGAFG